MIKTIKEWLQPKTQVTLPVPSWNKEIKHLDKLEKELDTINPNWVKESPKNTKEYLELLIEIYSLGVKPGKIHKLIDFKK